MSLPNICVAEDESRLAPLYPVLRRWFYNPDLQVSRIVFGAVQSHYLNLGDPACLMLVAPPSTGKSVIAIASAAALPMTLELSDFTENSFLSGFYGHKTPGILEKLGETTQVGEVYTTRGDAIILAKDFTTVLSMRRERRAAVLGQLREIYDGTFRRHFGTGQTKVWHGRITFIAAVTPVLDRYYSVFSTLGERFLQIRYHRPDSPEAGEWAIRQQGKEGKIREEIQRAVHPIFAEASKITPVLSDESMKRIACLAELVAKARTHVYREGHSREMEYIPEPEGNMRLSKGLAAIARGIASLEGHPEVVEQDLQDAFRVALDCVSDNRRRLLLACMSSTLAKVQIPSVVKMRELENLEALGVLVSTDDLLNARQYRLSDSSDSLLAKVNLIPDVYTPR